ncbi:Hypothetical Protein FCC1311_060832 [Hondaea fermentalgiana]|uniref:Uncharacterized protein n=1 Tax=Hondaea fermentalgiana TaxID=2315210 RepID=A0A2R5GMK3_9STRA|nr:Hypothetical Protein FCC1311_060832 [Hondaea fermentalgiana]|eukprot:GBG29863.1 Hypothetical Protein FCC1311_060832 [Hondaea fermentalgiana]
MRRAARRCNAACATAALGMLQAGLAAAGVGLIITRGDGVDGPGWGPTTVQAIALAALAASVASLGILILAASRMMTPNRAAMLVFALFETTSVAAALFVGVQLVLAALDEQHLADQNLTDVGVDPRVRLLLTAALCFAAAALGLFVGVCGNRVMRERKHESAVAKEIRRGRNPSLNISEDGVKSDVETFYANSRSGIRPQESDEAISADDGQSSATAAKNVSSPENPAILSLV